MSLRFVEAYKEAESHKLWTIDHQPTDLDQVVGDDSIIQVMLSFLKTDSLPNLIFCGPSGSGKSTLARAIVRTYLGKFVRNCHLEVIGSLSRGKNVLTERADKNKSNDPLSGPNIVNFIKQRVIKFPKHLCKVVTIYDFENMTTEAQMALRRVIEIYADRVRFIFICNDLNGIIEAVQSRSLTIKFAAIQKSLISQTLARLAKEHDMDLEPDILKALVIMSNGDLKQAVNHLQFFHRCSQSRSLETFYHIFNIPSIETVERLLDACLSRNRKQAFYIIRQLLKYGYTVEDILDVILKVVCQSDKLDEAQRVHLIQCTTRCFCLNEDCPSEVHLLAMIVQFLGGSKLQLFEEER